MIKSCLTILAVSSAVLADGNLMSYGGRTWVKSSARLAGLSAVEKSKLLGTPDPADKRVPEIWRDADVVPANNCYNYATSIITNTFAQPGSATDKPYNPMNITCEGVINGAESDGLIRVKKNQVGDYSGKNKACHYIGVVVTAPVAADDYHFFRLAKPGFDIDQTEKDQW
jgi:hypothetical protein